MNLATLKVLLLEDDTATAQLIAALLSAAPAAGAPAFAVEHIERRARAETRLAAGDVDLILLDLDWPDGRESDALARLQQWAAQWPVIVLTEHEDETLAMRAMQLGAQDYLAKDALSRPLLLRAARYAIERQHAATQQRENEERYCALAETAGDAIITIDEQNRMLYVNAAASRIFGYAGAELLGQPLTMLLPAHLRPQHLDGLARYREAGERRLSWQTIEMSGLHRSGREVPLEVSFSEFVWQGQRILTGIARDITERKQNEAALRQNERRFRALIEHSWDGVLLLTRTGEMLYASPSTHRIMGHVGDEMISQNAFALMHPEDLPQVVAQLQSLMTRPEATVNAEFRYQHKDGSWRWLECTCTNLLDAPSVGTLVINYRDITERKLNEAALRQARDELEQRVAERTAELQQRNRKLAQLYAEVQTSRRQLQQLSHRLVEAQENERRAVARELHDEVGQILTSLKMNLEVTRRLPPAAVAANLAQAQSQLDDLMSRVRNLSLDLRPAMLDDLGLMPALFWLFDRYTAQTKVQVKCKHVDIEGRYAPELETATYRIVQEALTNVARHSRAGEVIVLLWTTPDRLWAQIEDQGAGFDAERVIAAGHSSGLTGMRERALLLGGQLTIESAPGGGARITAELPLLKLARDLHARAATMRTA